MPEALNSRIDAAAGAFPGGSASLLLPTVHIRQGMCDALFAHEVGLSIDFDQA